jgi:heme A synthase
MYLAVNIQVASGIWNILEQVPVYGCVHHQTNALLTLSLALALLNSVKRPNARFLLKLERFATAQKVNKIGNL